MLRSVADAQRIILKQTRTLAAQTAPLSASALGLVLVEDIASDTDMPPHDKALMDGYAVRCADLREGRGTLAVIEEVTAGKVPTLPVGPGQATRIMTGAPIPEGADAVVMVERCQSQGDSVRVEDAPPKPGQNILTRGREMRQGEVVLKAGAVLRPQEFGLLATVGRSAVRVVPAPRVAILPTGDEVVEPGTPLQPGQIRNSNGPMLLAQTARAGGVPQSLGIARDRVEDLTRLIREGLSHDVLILSGGVSAGKLDLVPGVLQELGVVPHFHKVEMKPGKPLFFGTWKRPDGERPPALVFGLPGNPVSSLVCFELFIRPALRKLRGLPDPGPRFVRAALAQEFRYRTDRPTYHPARLTWTERGPQVAPTAWFGSADLRALTDANALVLFPPGDHTHAAGAAYDVLDLEERA